MELILAIALTIIAHRLRKASRRREVPQTVRIEVHHYWHDGGGPGERRPLETPLREKEPGTNVVAFRPTRAA
jgi:hypothetical protein